MTIKFWQTGSAITDPATLSCERQHRGYYPKNDHRRWQNRPGDNSPSRATAPWPPGPEAEPHRYCHGRHCGHQCQQAPLRDPWNRRTCGGLECQGTGLTGKNEQHQDAHAAHNHTCTALPKGDRFGCPGKYNSAQQQNESEREKPDTDEPDHHELAKTGGKRRTKKSRCKQHLRSSHDIVCIGMQRRNMVKRRSQPISSWLQKYCMCTCRFRHLGHAG